MNVSKVAGHGYSNYASHHFNRFEKATINVQDNNISTVQGNNLVTMQDDNPATKVTINPNAQALENEEKFSLRQHQFNGWLYAVKVEALKNGTSMRTAVRKYGRETAEYIAEIPVKGYKFIDPNDPELANRFLEGITRYMDGESYKDAFNLTEQDPDYKYLNKENDFLEGRYGELDLELKKAREGYYEAKKRGRDEGVYFSYRYGCWISPPDNKAIQSDEEEVKKKVPQDKKGDEAAPQDKNEIFKDFAEQIIESNRKKATKHSKKFLHLYDKFGVNQADNVS
ncbi:MAG: hypothetical protein LBC87_00110 [Fibromonadaceae bacterium]|jgi:hypothetical protein|nr:hypothetical protein [Fibromonadaceae bacterium]